MNDTTVNEAKNGGLAAPCASVRRPRRAAAALVAAALLAPAARAVLPRVYPLGQVIQGSEWIAAGTASQVDAAKGRMTFHLSPIKGAVPGGPGLSLAAAGKPGSDLTPRVAKGQALVAFGSKSGGGMLVGFTEGTWFMAKRAESGWSLTAVRPDMSRTWTGRSADLAKLVASVVAGKTAAPAPDLKRKPSLGPVVQRKIK